jgi:hypothetical protein
MKLFIARFEIEFAFLGESSSDAGRFVDDAISDVTGKDVEVREVHFTKLGHAVPPDGWDDDCLVYHAGRRDISFAEAAEPEKVRRHNAEMAARQANLFTQEKP